MSWKMMTAIVGQLAHDTVPENFLKTFINVFSLDYYYYRTQNQ